MNAEGKLAKNQWLDFQLTTSSTSKKNPQNRRHISHRVQGTIAFTRTTIIDRSECFFLVGPPGIVWSYFRTVSL